MKKISALILTLLILFLGACDSTDANVTVTYPEVTEGTYTVEEIDLEKVSYEAYDEELCIVLDGESESYTITEEGTYILRGTITETVTVDVGDEDVRLILDNVTISTDLNSAILVLSADDVEISVPEGTVNYLSDSENYSELYSEYGSVLYSEADLVINGSGSLEVVANYNNGIQTKDDLILLDLTLDVTSVDDGIIGRDSLTVQNADITVTSQGDSIKTTYTSEEETDTEKGYLQVISGSVTLNSGDDGIQTTSNVIVDGGTITINADSKGLKSDAALYYNDGTLTINSTDDAIHVVTDLFISGGTLNITAGDDAIHSDDYLYISDGVINIYDCFEGIEGKYIYISGGTMDITAEDDGINGSDPEIGIEDAARPGEVADPTTSTALVEISGGVIIVESEDDSIDSNGILNISGGNIVVNGPTSGAQSSFDYDIEFNLTGGTLIAVSGYGQETKTPTADSTQVSLMYNLGSTQYAGTLISLLDEDGNVIVSFASEKYFQAVFISTPDLDNSTTYTLCVGGTITGDLTNGYYSDGTLEDYTVVETFELNDTTNEFNLTDTTTNTPPARR